MDALKVMIDKADELVIQSDLEGELYFAGATAESVDDRYVNNRNLIVIVIVETLLIFTMLIFLTRSFRMPIYMMGTILLSFLAALGLGMFLSNLFFDIGTVSNRVPVYSFIFLVALGIDYNIFLVSRYQEERKKHPVKKAVEIAVANTGGGHLFSRDRPSSHFRGTHDSTNRDIICFSIHCSGWHIARYLFG